MNKPSNQTRRGLTYTEAMIYAGVKRRQFDDKWRPRLVAIQQGVCLIFDRQDLDRLFDEFKQEAETEIKAPLDSRVHIPHNGGWNGRPIIKKGLKPWAKKLRESSQMETNGKSISGNGNSDFESAVFEVLPKRTTG